MSRMYSMHVKVYLKPEETAETIEKIKEALIEQWPVFGEDLEVWECPNPDGEGNVDAVSGYGDGSLSGTENEFLDTLAAAVWTAVGEYRRIELSCVDLTNLPWDDHSADETDYKRLMEAKS